MKNRNELYLQNMQALINEFLKENSIGNPGYQVYFTHVCQNIFGPRLLEEHQETIVESITKDERDLILTLMVMLTFTADFNFTGRITSLREMGNYALIVFSYIEDINNLLKRDDLRIDEDAKTYIYEYALSLARHIKEFLDKKSVMSHS